MISDRHVLTAAHCFFVPHTNDRSPIGAVGYASHKENNSMKASVSRVELNPTYRNVNPFRGSDTAIVTLADPVNFGDDVRPLCLPSLPLWPVKYVNQEAIAAGWGETETGYVNELKETRVKILSKRRCSRLTKRWDSDRRFRKYKY